MAAAVNSTTTTLPSNANHQSSQVTDFVAAALSQSQMLRIVKHQVRHANLLHQLSHQQASLQLQQELCIQEASAVHRQQLECVVAEEETSSPPLSPISPNRFLQEALQRDNNSPSQSHNREGTEASDPQVAPTSPTLAEASLLQHRQDLWALLALEAGATGAGSLRATLTQSNSRRYNNEKTVGGSLPTSHVRDSTTKKEASTGTTSRDAASYHQFIRTEVELKSLQQLSSELDEEDKEFIVSLRHVL